MYRIVVGVDGSTGALGALEWSINVARLRNGRVTALHAWLAVPGDTYGFGMVDPNALDEAERAILDETVDQADATGLSEPVDRVLMAGTPAHSLIQAAQDADLVVVGSRGRGGFAGLLLGSVSHQLAQHAPRPVVIVPATWTRTDHCRIVVGVDGSPGANAALSWALEWAKTSRVGIEVVLAFDPELAWIDVGSRYEDDWIEHATAGAEAEVQEIVDSVSPGAAGLAVSPAAVLGPPARALLDRSRDADLLVVGTRGRGGFSGLLLGSVSQRCIEYAACPVAVIPTTGA